MPNYQVLISFRMQSIVEVVAADEAAALELVDDELAADNDLSEFEKDESSVKIEILPASRRLRDD